jgi:hypothetical protein
VARGWPINDVLLADMGTALIEIEKPMDRDDARGLFRSGRRHRAPLRSPEAAICPTHAEAGKCATEILERR